MSIKFLKPIMKKPFNFRILGLLEAAVACVLYYLRYKQIFPQYFFKNYQEASASRLILLITLVIMQLSIFIYLVRAKKVFITFSFFLFSNYDKIVMESFDHYARPDTLTLLLLGMIVIIRIGEIYYVNSREDTFPDMFKWLFSTLFIDTCILINHYMMLNRHLRYPM